MSVSSFCPCLCYGSGLLPSSQAWNFTRLRSGDLAGESSQPSHSNAWDFRSTVRVAFGELGGGSGARAVKETTHAPIAAESVAAAYHWKMGFLAEKLAEGMADGSAQVKWVYVERAFDATPIEVEFGKLERLLYKVARYWSFVNGEPRLLTCEEAESAKMRMKTGVVEMLAQTAYLEWEGLEGVRRERPVLPTRFIQRANASNEFAAVEGALRSFGAQGLMKLAAAVAFVLLAVRGDSAPSNIRMKSWIQQQIEEFNRTPVSGKVLFIDVFCIGHMLMNIISREFKLVSLVPRSYNISYTFRYAPRYNRLLSALREKILRDLETGGFVAGPPGHPGQSLEQVRHTQKILSLFLTRPLRTRGRDPSQSEARHEPMLRAIHKVLCQLLNGDIRQPKVQHVGSGDCKAIAMKIADAMVAGSLVLQCSFKSPALPGGLSGVEGFGCRIDSMVRTPHGISPGGPGFMFSALRVPAAPGVRGRGLLPQTDIQHSEAFLS